MVHESIKKETVSMEEKHNILLQNKEYHSLFTEELSNWEKKIENSIENSEFNIEKKKNIKYLYVNTNVIKNIKERMNECENQSKKYGVKFDIHKWRNKIQKISEKNLKNPEKTKYEKKLLCKNIINNLLEKFKKIKLSNCGNDMSNKDKFKIRQKYNYKKELVYLTNEWDNYLECRINDYRKNLYNKDKKKIFSDLEETLSNIELLSNHLDIPPKQLWDLSKGSCKYGNVQDILNWAKTIDFKSIEYFSELLGRGVLINTTFETKNKSVIENKESTIISTKLYDAIENVGIKCGDIVSNIIPSELNLLSDDDTEDLFYYKLATKQILLFDKETQYNEKIEEKINIQVTNSIENIISKNENEHDCGPLILCIDTSRSMAGHAEIIEKAISYILINHVLKQNRKCILINFSTGIKHTMLDENSTQSEIFKVLNMSYWGGTSPNIALNYAITMLKTKDYKKADVVMISDFYMKDISLTNKFGMTTMKEKNNKFYAIIIGHEYNSSILECFDPIWKYDPITHKICPY